MEMDDPCNAPKAGGEQVVRTETSSLMENMFKHAEQKGGLACFGTVRNPAATPMPSPAAQTPAPAEKPTPPQFRTYRRLDSELTPKQRRARQKRTEWLKKLFGPTVTFDLPESIGPLPLPDRNAEGGSNV